MLDIILILPDGPPESIRLEAPETWIGSGLEADLTVPDATLAPRHACIRKVDEGYRLAVREGFLPVMINDQLSHGKLLAEGDSIGIGPARIEIRTLWLETRERKPPGGAFQSRLLLQVPGSDLVDHEVRKPRTLIGRSKECDIQIRDPGVLNRHAVLTRSEAGYQIRQLPGPSSLRVNGQLATSRILQHGDEIEIGKSILCFASNRPVFKTMADLVYSQAGVCSPGTRSEKDLEPPEGHDVDDPAALLEGSGEEGFKSVLDFENQAPQLAEDNPLRYLLEEERSAIRDRARETRTPYDRASERVEEFTEAVGANQKDTWLGGYSQFKSWVTHCQQQLAQVRGLQPPFPKGLLILGLPGSGKQLAVRAVSFMWRVPIVRIRLERLFEEPPDQWIDMFGGVMSRVQESSPRIVLLANIDRDMESLYQKADKSIHLVEFYNMLVARFVERRPGIFLAVTGTNPQWIHRDVLKRGHVVDELFFVDLPDARTRGEVFSVILSQAGDRPESFDVPRLISITHGFSSGEILEVIDQARKFGAGRPLTTEGIEVVASRHTPRYEKSRLMVELRAAGRKLCIRA